MIKVYLDTNMLEDYAEHNLIISDKILSDKFYDFLNKVASNAALYSAMTIVIPQVVIDEISQHIKETYDFIDDQIKKIKNVYKSYNNNQIITDKTREQVIEDFNNELEGLVNKYPFIVTEKHKDSIGNIYYRAINKKSPFYMKNKGLDSGFKDSILWKTANENKGVSKPIICTDDNDFDGCGIEVIRSFDKLIEYANENYSSKKDLIISFISQDYIKEKMADELGYSKIEKIEVELLNYLEVDDPEFYDTDVVEIKLNIDNITKIAEFFINIPVNEVTLNRIIDNGE